MKKDKLKKSPLHKSLPSLVIDDDQLGQEVYRKVEEANDSFKSVEAEIVLPTGTSITTSAHKNTSMMDLLADISTKNGIDPSDVCLKAASDRPPGYLQFKAYTPIGSLNCHRIEIIPKADVCERHRQHLINSDNLPCQRTIRIQVDLPNQQKSVFRFDVESTLDEVQRKVCEESKFDDRKYVLRSARFPYAHLVPNLRLEEAETVHFALVSSKENLSKSTGDIFALYAKMPIEEKEEKQKSKGIFWFFRRRKQKRKSSLEANKKGSNPNLSSINQYHDEASSRDKRTTKQYQGRPLSLQFEKTGLDDEYDAPAHDEVSRKQVKKRPAPKPPVPTVQTNLTSTTTTIQPTLSSYAVDDNASPIRPTVEYAVVVSEEHRSNQRRISNTSSIGDHEDTSAQLSSPDFGAADRETPARFSGDVESSVQRSVLEKSANSETSATVVTSEELVLRQAQEQEVTPPSRRQSRDSTFASSSSVEEERIVKAVSGRRKSRAPSPPPIDTSLTVHSLRKLDDGVTAIESMTEEEIVEEKSGHSSRCSSPATAEEVQQNFQDVIEHIEAEISAANGYTEENETKSNQDFTRPHYFREPVEVHSLNYVDDTSLTMADKRFDDERSVKIIQTTSTNGTTKIFIDPDVESRNESRNGSSTNELDNSRLAFTDRPFDGRDKFLSIESLNHPYSGLDEDWQPIEPILPEAHSLKEDECIINEASHISESPKLAHKDSSNDLKLQYFEQPIVQPILRITDKEAPLAINDEKGPLYITDNDLSSVRQSQTSVAVIAGSPFISDSLKDEFPQSQNENNESAQVLFKSEDNSARKGSDTLPEQFVGYKFAENVQPQTLNVSTTSLDESWAPSSEETQFKRRSSQLDQIPLLDEETPPPAPKSPPPFDDRVSIQDLHMNQVNIDFDNRQLLNENREYPIESRTSPHESSGRDIHSHSPLKLNISELTDGNSSSSTSPKYRRDYSTSPSLYNTMSPRPYVSPRTRIAFTDPKRNLYPSMVVKNFEDEYYSKELKDDYIRTMKYGFHDSDLEKSQQSTTAPESGALSYRPSFSASNTSNAERVKEKRRSEISIDVGSGRKNAENEKQKQHEQSEKVEKKSPPPKIFAATPVVAVGGNEKEELLYAEYDKLQAMFALWQDRSKRNEAVTKRGGQLSAIEVLEFQRLQSALMKQHQLVQKLCPEGNVVEKSKIELEIRKPGDKSFLNNNGSPPTSKPVGQVQNGSAASNLDEQYRRRTVDVIRSSRKPDALVSDIKSVIIDGNRAYVTENGVDTSSIVRPTEVLAAKRNFQRAQEEMSSNTTPNGQIHRNGDNTVEATIFITPPSTISRGNDKKTFTSEITLSPIRMSNGFDQQLGSTDISDLEVRDNLFQSIRDFNGCLKLA